MARLPGWEPRLHALVERHTHTPFAWRTHDCYTFACEVVLALTGEALDPAGPYAGVRGAYRAVKRMGGGGSYRTAIESVLGPAVPGELARRGDLVLLPLPGSLIGDALGVCLGGSIAFPGPEGLLIQRAVATRYVAFRI